MSDRSRTSKAPAQYALGILFCLVGGFFSVSIVLSLWGQEPRSGLLTFPVVELLLWLGPWGALLLSAAVAVLGALLIVRDEALVAGRPLAAVAVVACGLACLLGPFGLGGELGAVFPAGLAGKLLGVGLGLVVAWVGLSLLAGRRRPRSEAGTAPRIGLSTRTDVASGVSAAEAALLVTEPRAASPRPARREDPALVEHETIRPFMPRKDVPEPARTRRVDPPAAPVRPQQEPLASKIVTPIRPAETLAARTQMLTVPAPSPETLPTPSWELGEGEEGAVLATAPVDEQEWVEEEAPLAALEDDLADELDDDLDTEEGLADPDAIERGIEQGNEREGEEETEEEDVEEPDEGASPAKQSTPRASWEQIGLFDEEEAAEEKAGDAGEESRRPGASRAAELTPSLDFEPARRSKPHAHEPESVEDPFALEPAPASRMRAAEHERGQEYTRESTERESTEEVGAAELEQRTRASDPAPQKRGPVIEPKVAPGSQPRAPREQESERWKVLVFEAGCAILEQKRVAVSMLERRFGIDFDQACRVLDELQQAGLIGPYMGGRTRDILLGREEWLAHAPHPS